MVDQIKDTDWVWVIIERYQTDEKLFGQFDEKRNESFIPVFHSKENALMVLGRLAKRKDHYYQVQASRYGEVAAAARETGFMLFFLDGEGQILDRVVFSH